MFFKLIHISATVFVSSFCLPQVTKPVKKVGQNVIKFKIKKGNTLFHIIPVTLRVFSKVVVLIQYSNQGNEINTNVIKFETVKIYIFCNKV